VSALDTPRIPAAAFRAHSRLIRLLRVVLPGMVLGLAALLGLLILNHAVRVEATAPRETATQIRMVNPHFFGRDRQGRAFEVSAAEAARSDSNMQEVLLEDVSVTLDVNGAHPSRMTADHGAYREDTRILLLRGNVRVDDGRASSIATNQATVDTRAGTVVGDQRVASRTTAGDIQAGEYQVENRGDRVIFRGGVRARVNPH
jgi:lipopolysaccharide export system protein LptC